MSKNLTKLENTLAEIDTYTNYCALIDYQVDKAKEFAAKNAALVINQAQSIVAAFPYGVGPTIIAAKIQAMQLVVKAEDVVEQAAVPVAIAAKLATLPAPSQECEPNDLP